MMHEIKLRLVGLCYLNGVDRQSGTANFRLQQALPSLLTETYTPFTKLLARQARPGTTHDGSGIEAETYSSISATNQHQLRQKI